MQIIGEQFDPVEKWWNRLTIDPRFYRQDMEKDESNLIYWFKDENQWASNFEITPVFYKDQWFISSEHAYQWSKVMLKFGENPDMVELLELAQEIKEVKSPGATKRMARKCKLPENWDGIKVQIMKEILDSKFNNPKMLTKLLDTQNKYLVEGTVWHDCDWGICIKPNCEKCNGKIGNNFLGVLLMELREYVRNELKKEVELLKLKH